MTDTDDRGVHSARVILADYLRILYRRRWIAAAVLLSVLLGAAVYIKRAVPLYEARVSVIIDIDEPNVVNITQVYNDAPTQMNYFPTQHELLKSRALVTRTAGVLELEKRPGSGVSSRTGAINAIRGAIEVAPVRGSRLVNIAVRWPNPQVAAEIANAHAHQYVDQSLEKRFDASKEASEWLDKQLADERARVTASERALQAFREQHDAISLEKGQDIVVQKLADLNTAVTRAKTARIEAEAKFRELSAARNDPAALDAFPAILGNAFIQSLKANLANLEREYAQLSETLGDRHPTMLEKRSAIETTERRISAEVDRVVESMRTAYQSAQAEEVAMSKALEDQKQEAMALNRRGIEYTALQREAESVRQVYQTLLQRAKETGIAQQLRSTNITVVDPAEVPKVPVYPRTTMTLIMALLVGSCFAVGVVFLFELADDRIVAPEDVRRRLGQRLLALIPRTRVARAGERVSLLNRNVPTSTLEAFRGLRTSVISAVGVRSTRSIVVTSASPGEGKTHVASNLAISLSQAHHRVLLIDADTRRSTLHAVFGHAGEAGLSDLLKGEATLQQVLRPSSQPGLTVIGCGAHTTAAPELLGSTAFEQLMAILEEHFTWVVIDTPPALALADATLLASHASAIVLVVGCGKTRARAARMALEELRKVGANVIGAVLNNADAKGHPYYFPETTTREYALTPAETGQASV